MVIFEQSSAFITPPGEIGPKGHFEYVLLYSSNNGYSELYRCDIDGRFRIYKALKPQFRGNPIYERLLRKEYEIGYELDHVNICKIFSYHQVEGLGNCIEMEYIDGRTLQEEIEGDNLDKETVRKIIIELCDALIYIHHKQIIHRDLKPQNILITHNGKNVKLIDFGLSDTDWHSILKGKAGTMYYAAPELLENGEIDNRTDIWSLGIIIRDLSDRYKQIVRKCTYTDKEKRFSSAEEIKRSILYKEKRMYLWIAIGAIATIAAIIATMSIIDYNTVTGTVDSIFENIGDKIIDAQNY